MSLIPTASQTVGPYLHLGLTPITIADIARDATKGETIVISGRVLDGEGKPIPDALLEFWQANADGKYAHPEDTQDKRSEEHTSELQSLMRISYAVFCLKK